MRNILICVALCVLSCGLAWSQEADLQIELKGGLKFKWESSTDNSQTITVNQDPPQAATGGSKASCDFDVKETKDGRLNTFAVKVNEFESHTSSAGQDQSCGADLTGREIVWTEGTPSVTDGESNPIAEESQTALAAAINVLGVANCPELATKRTVKKGDKFSGQECVDYLVGCFRRGFISNMGIEGVTLDATKSSGELTYEVTEITAAAVTVTLSGSTKYVLDGNAGGNQITGDLTLDITATFKVNRSTGFFDGENIDVRLQANVDVMGVKVACDQRSAYKSEYTYAK
jgi:hypothetical protein